LKLPTEGYQGRGAEFNMNASKLRADAADLGVSIDLAVSTTIAHEGGFHIIAGKSFHYHESGFVDAVVGKVGGVFSDEAAERVVRKLDLVRK